MAGIAAIIDCVIGFGLAMLFAGYCYSMADEDGEQYW